MFLAYSYVHILLQFQFIIKRGNSANGFVAIDVVEFRDFEACEFTPPNAKPVPTTAPPTTTKAPTTSVTTTIEPTEPPDCKFTNNKNALNN